MDGADEEELARTFDAVLADEVWVPRRVMQWLYASIVDAPAHVEGESTQVTVGCTLAGGHTCCQRARKTTARPMNRPTARPQL